MKTSAEGIAFLERHEGVVLKAYRDPVGIWTIGAGLTKASGVINPKAGMKISKREASDLLGKALNRNYEPAVARTMPGAKQHEFDAGVSFHFNTGAIGRASWVKAWSARNWPEVKRRLGLWRKAKGRVLPGLVRRREEEFDVMRDADYGTAPARSPSEMLARIVVPIDGSEMAEIRAGLAGLGLDVGRDARGVRVGAVVKFQRDHDLTVDGIIGMATLSTLQRRLDARKKTKDTALTSATGTAVGAGSGAADLVDPSLSAVFVALVLLNALLFALWYTWKYRDVLAAKIQNTLPSLARKLRSF
ncbi:glycoside hydrolase family protein [Roseobacter sp. S98]|uniref:glycoside hydrolase family protein n=1 Tax=Roseobacter algicola (ex Choi et al. 2025) (nom. illeg.) TaxID=3092138 RepID=UPI0035C66E3E